MRRVGTVGEGGVFGMVRGEGVSGGPCSDLRVRVSRPGGCPGRRRRRGRVSRVPGFDLKGG